MWVTRVAAAAALASSGLVVVPGLAEADPSTPTPSPPPSPKTMIDVDGTYAVGTEIVPGVYTSAGPFPDGTCSWKRTSDPDGATIDIALTHEPQVVLIDPADQSFKTTGCQTWRLTDGATPDATTIPPVLAGLQLQAYLAQLNARAAASGQLSPP